MEENLSLDRSDLHRFLKQIVQVKVAFLENKRNFSMIFSMFLSFHMFNKKDKKVSRHRDILISGDLNLGTLF
jgi:hypothetical protein